MTTISLKEKTAQGLFLGGINSGIQQVLNLFFGIFLARLLSPALPFAFIAAGVMILTSYCTKGIANIYLLLLDAAVNPPQK